MRLPRLTFTPAAAALIGVLAGCTSTAPDATASATPSESPSASASSTASPEPTSEAPSAAPTAGADNDPGDGVATDPAVSEPAEPSEGAITPVDVVLSRYGVVGDDFIAGGYVDGIVESGGTCLLTLSAGSATATASGAATPSANSTACGDGLSIPVADLDAGEWTVTVSYESDSFEGVSAAEKVTIP